MTASANQDWITAAEAVTLLESSFGIGGARRRICERAHAGLILGRAEQFHVDGKVQHEVAIPAEFWWADGHAALEQDWTAGDFSTWIDHRIELKAFCVTFLRSGVEKLLPLEARTRTTPSASHSSEDWVVIERIHQLVPSAALSFRQAVMDIAQEERVSFRGPALELREALREVLDHLAPDEAVTALPGFLLEKERSGPTMKQKVRFIMKKKRSSPDVPEQAVAAFEESIASLTRAVYERSSRSAHTADDRATVVQLRRYVVAVFHDILES